MTDKLAESDVLRHLQRLNRGVKPVDEAELLDDREVLPGGMEGENTVGVEESSSTEGKSKKPKHAPPFHELEDDGDLQAKTSPGSDKAISNDDWTQYLGEGLSGADGGNLGDLIKPLLERRQEQERKTPENTPETPKVIEEPVPIAPVVTETNEPSEKPTEKSNAHLKPEIPVVSKEGSVKPIYDVRLKDGENLNQSEQVRFKDFENLLESGQVTEVSFPVNTDTKDPRDPNKSYAYVDYINLTGNGGKEASIAVQDLVNKFSGVEYFYMKNTGVPAGIRFIKEGQESQYIFPGSNTEVVRKLLLRVKFNGKFLKNKDFKVHFSWPTNKLQV
jgi:hypothetical protein